MARAVREVRKEAEWAAELTEKANWVSFLEVSAKLHELEAKVSGVKHAWSTADRRVVLSHLILSLPNFSPRTQDSMHGRDSNSGQRTW